MSVRDRTVPISGAGIAGPTLAYWLRQSGFVPTIVERAPALPSGGYMIDFWGVGFEVARRMGLLPAIEAAGYHIDEVRLVDRMTGASPGSTPPSFSRPATVSSSACCAGIWRNASLISSTAASKPSLATASLRSRKTTAA